MQQRSHPSCQHPACGNFTVSLCTHREREKQLLNMNKHLLVLGPGARITSGVSLESYILDRQATWAETRNSPPILLSPSPGHPHHSFVGVFLKAKGKVFLSCMLAGEGQRAHTHLPLAAPSLTIKLLPLDWALRCCISHMHGKTRIV